MPDPIARQLYAAAMATQGARNILADHIARLRAEVDAARRVLAFSTTPRPALHRALRIARAELSHFVAAIA